MGAYSVNHVSCLDGCICRERERGVCMYGRGEWISVCVERGCMYGRDRVRCEGCAYGSDGLR